MRNYPALSSLLLLVSLGAFTHAETAVPSNPPTGRLTFPFDASWRFLKNDATGAEQTSFNDSAWRTLDVPHDWSIEGPFAVDAAAARGGAYLPTGIGWYRKSFSLPAEDISRRVAIDFEGIMANADVWVNGFHLGQRPSGYVGQFYDLTNHLNFGPGKTNVIAVRVDNSIQHASRYYTGSGIEHHVRLVVADPVHVEKNGLYVTTPAITPAPGPGVAPTQAVVHVQTSVTNTSATARTISVQTTLLGPDGKPAQSATSAPQTIAMGQSVDFSQDITVASPKLWNLDQPNLYQAVAKVVDAGKVLDDETTTFGIRKIEFKPETGFWLNGKNIKILGVCLHEDGGAVGEAVPRAIYESRLSAMKALGANAIRWSHNPASPDALDLCDRLGLLAMDEMFDCWTVDKPNAEKGYNLFFKDWSLLDVRDSVCRDRNHPSIIFWSTGNEIHDTPQEEKARNILWGLVHAVHQYDSTRFVTQALFRPGTSHDYTNGLADMLDVIGTNYRDSELLAAQRAQPTRLLVNTEERHDRAAWLLVRDNPPLSGCFLWAGIDYLGEGAPAARDPGVDDPSSVWPNISSGSGLYDRDIVQKTSGLERESWWSPKPVVHLVRTRSEGDPTAPLGSGGAAPPGAGAMIANWTPRQPASYPDATIHVLSNCDDVELFLNGQSLGSKPKPADDSPRVWNTPFRPGTLKAVGKNAGKEVAARELRTAGAPAKIMLVSERAKIAPVFDDVAIVRAEVTDANGVRIPWADNLITFKVSGPGAVIATDNALNSDHTLFQSQERKANQGRCVAYVRATAPSGQITLTASADGLTSGTATIQATPTSTGK